MTPEKVKIEIFDLIVLFNVVVFATMWLAGGFKVDTDVLIQFGAKFNYKMVSGQWWRFITPMFLHVDLMHLLMNTLGVISLSQPLKHIFGLKRLLPIYLVSGVSGVVLSFAFSNSLSAGASTAIFGMMGAHLYLYLRHPSAYKNIFGSSFLVVIGINFAYGFIAPGIDNLGHLGGFIGGFFVAVALGVNRDSLWRIQLLVIPLLCLTLAGGVIFGNQRYDQSAHYYLMHFLDAYEDENFNEAYERLQKGFSLHPEDSDLKGIMDQINPQK